MSQKEIKRIKVMELLVNGRMTNQEAAESLGLCRRQIIRLRKKYTTQGEMGLIHGNRDRRPQHRIVIGIWLAKGESTSNDVVAWPACGYL